MTLNPEEIKKLFKKVINKEASEEEKLVATKELNNFLENLNKNIENVLNN